MHRRGNKKKTRERPGIYMHSASFDSVFFFGLGVRRTGLGTLGIHSRSPGPRYVDASRTAFRRDEKMTEEQPGYKSCKRLATELQREFGSIIEVDEFDVDCDAFGWRLSSQPRLVFSLSTEGSALPEDTFDLQVSIIDDSLENGEILFGPESPYLSINEVCSVVERFHRGEYNA